MAVRPEFLEMTKKVNRIISYWDPAQVEPGKPNGAPADEYEPEASRIASFILKNQEKGSVLTLENVCGEVNRVWKTMFSETCPKAIEIADAILSELKKA